MVVKLFFVLPSKSFTATCNLEESSIHERLNQSFNALLAKPGSPGPSTRYEAGEERFKIVRKVPLRSGYSTIIGNAVLSKENAGVSIHIDYYIADNYTKYFLKFFSAFPLVVWLCTISMIFSKDFKAESFLSLLAFCLISTSTIFTLKQFYLNSMITLHEEVATKLSQP